MANFDPNAILRGAQLTLVGANRAMQNPRLFKADIYRYAALAVAVGIAIRIVIAVPILLVRFLYWTKSAMSSREHVPTRAQDIEDGFHFIEHSVLQIPFFLMSLMRYLSPALDTMFMDSLEWVDSTYLKKHESDDASSLRAMYHANLRMYSTHGESSSHKNPMQGLVNFLIRYGRRAGTSLTIYLLSFLPFVGWLVLPAASFYAFNDAVGFAPAAAIFGTSIFLPKRYLVMFLQSYFSSRSLMRQLLEPYFKRVRFDREQKRMWFRDREGVLFGFALAFTVMLKVPILGVLIYGIAEASTAYLLTKITDPPPPPSDAETWKQSQIRWQNKHEFLSLSLSDLDLHNVQIKPQRTVEPEKEIPRRKFT